MTKGQLTVEVKMQEYSVEKFFELDFCTLQIRRGKRIKQAARRICQIIYQGENNKCTTYSS